MTTGRLPIFRIGRHHPRATTLNKVRAYCREVPLVATSDMARDVGVCHETANAALTTLVELGELYRVRRGLYRCVEAMAAK